MNPNAGIPRTSKHYALSDKQILKGLESRGIDAKFIEYDDIIKCECIEDVVSSQGFALIIYKNLGDKVGHWCCLFFRSNGDLEFFDSYGLMIDEILDDEPFGGRYRDALPSVNAGNMTVSLPYLSYLILQWMGRNPGKSVHYNGYALQSLKSGISTCGRWSLARMWLYDKPITAFGDLFSADRDPDDLVTKVTNKFLGWS